jgi:hypothetical protein
MSLNAEQLSEVTEALAKARKLARLISESGADDAVLMDAQGISDHIETALAIILDEWAKH